MIRKDRTIRELLSVIKERTPITDANLVNYWDGDLFAIGIQIKDRLIYILTFNHRNKHTQLYDYEVERTDTNGETMELLKEASGVSQEEIIGMIRSLTE